KLQHVREIARPLHREDEAIRRIVSPASKAVGDLHAIERAVDLDRVELRRQPGEFLLVVQSLRLELPAPGLVGPAGNADTDVLRHGRPTPMAGSLFLRGRIACPSS